MTNGNPILHSRALDGLRGIAILAVLGHHLTYFVPFTKTLVERDLFTPVFRALISGWWGVDLFFVLSGFLITRLLVQNREREDYFSSFYFRRSLRIFPVYYLILLVSFLLLRSYPLLWQSGSSENWIWMATYLTNFKIMLDGWAGIPVALGHLWSLAVEEQFYLVWPLIVWAFSPKKLLWVTVGMILLSLGVRGIYTVGIGDFASAYVSPFARMDQLGVGAVLALILQSGTLSVAPNIIRWSKFLLLASVALVTALFIATDGYNANGDILVTNFAHPLITLGSAALIVLCQPHGSHWYTRLLESRFLRAFGLYSYSLYLIHPLVIAQLRFSGFYKYVLQKFGDSSAVLLILQYLITPAVCFGISALLWRWFESPILRWRDRITQNSRSGTPSKAGGAWEEPSEEAKPDRKAKAPCSSSAEFVSDLPTSGSPDKEMSARE